MQHAADHLHYFIHAPAASRWTARIASAVSVFLLARLLLLAISPIQMPLTTSSEPVIRDERSKHIGDWHLFGVANGEAPIAVTDLALVLRGIVGSDTSSAAIAIISGQDGTETSYHVGDPLPGGAIVQSVRRDHVVLQYRGHLESLGFPETSVEPQPGSMPSGDSPPALSSTSTTLGAQVNVLPVMQNGQITGATLSALDVSLLERAGLRRDDVVISVDGHSIDAADQIQALQARLRIGGELKAIIRRDGREQELLVRADK